MTKETTNDWRPMSEHQFPWPHRDLIVLAFAYNDSNERDVFRCKCAEHGALFIKSSGFLSIIEEGYIPYAWKLDDTPERDDEKLPPMWTDYLTADLSPTPTEHEGEG